MQEENNTAPVNPREGDDSWRLWEDEATVTVTETETQQAMGNNGTTNVYSNTMGSTSQDTLLEDGPSPPMTTPKALTIDSNIHRRLPEEHREALNWPIAFPSNSSHAKSSSSSQVSLGWPTSAEQAATRPSTASSTSSGRRSPPERPSRPEAKDLPNLKRPPFPPVPPKADGYLPRPRTAGSAVAEKRPATVGAERRPVTSGCAAAQRPPTPAAFVTHPAVFASGPQAPAGAGAFGLLAPNSQAGYEAMPLPNPYAVQPVGSRPVHVVASQR